MFSFPCNLEFGSYISNVPCYTPSDTALLHMSALYATRCQPKIKTEEWKLPSMIKTNMGVVKIHAIYF